VTEQLTFEAMPRRLFACTPSRLANFDCPRRYRMTYLDRPTPARGAPWAHNTLGAVVHLALHRWWQLPRAARTSAGAGGLIERHWQHDGFRDEQQSAQYRETARVWVENYVSALDPDDEPLGVERTVGATTSRLALSGRVDRIDDRDGELVVVDYKTGRTTPDADDVRASQALALYAVAVARTFHRPCTRVELHHLPSGQIVSHAHTPESLQRHVQRAENTADDIGAATDTLAAASAAPVGESSESSESSDSTSVADELFAPAPGPSCSWCDFRRICPEGRQASVQRESWTGLAGSD
jgi:putative RecB family exonuclease